MFIKSLMVAISTYSIIPVPNFEWSEKNMRYALCFFPVVGIVCGVLMWLFFRFGTVLNLSGFFTAAAAVCIPLLITGGIHMDGFMDTVDAISSHQTREKKLEILSDPHCGAFAVIYCAVYLILNLAFLYEIHSVGNLFVICPIYVLSRSISSLCAVNLPNARKSGMLSAYTKNAERKTVNIWMIVAAFVSAGLMARISPIPSAFAIGLGLLWTFMYCRITKRQFGGVTGDTAGFFLQMFELFCIAGAWIGAII
ncbi:MAG: adenosylcobinamide-GDP ribazoletransferase [Firmicutes bacterium]|nr:adenosylcobinamide-GDP ribazoletransferase [Bacillota bacterium]